MPMPVTFGADDVPLLRDLLAVSLTGVGLLRPVYEPAGEVSDFAIEYLNPAGQRMTGLAEQPEGTFCAHFPQARTNGGFDFYRRVYETGEAGQFEQRHHSGGTDFCSRVAAQRSGERLVVSFADEPRQTAGQNLDLSRVQELEPGAPTEHQRLEHLFMQAPAAVCILSGPELVFELVNPTYQQFFPERQLLGKPLLEALPELADHAAYHTMRRVFDAGESLSQQALHTPLARATDGVLEDRYFTYVQQPRYDAQGRVDGVLVFGFEVTELVQARQQAEALQTQVLAVAQLQVQERETFYQIFEQTPALVALLRSPGHRFEYVNPAYQSLFPGRQLVGRNVAEAVPNLQAQGFVVLLDRVFQTGETYFGLEMPFTTESAADQPARTGYFNFTYQAYREHGQVAGISIFAFDVTEKVLARQERDAQQHKFYTLFAQAPIGISIFAGPDLTYEFVNESYQRLLPDRVLLGRPLLQALPELVDTDVEAMLRRVYETGETEQVQAFPVLLARSGDDGQSGELEQRFFTMVYQARRDAQGRINGILNFVVEVTEQVRDSQRVADSREELKRYQFMADQARDPFILIRQDGSFAYLNRRALEAWGYTAEEMRHLRVPDLDALYQENGFNQLFARAQEEAIPLFETQHRRKDGRVYPVEVSAAGLRFDGQPHLLVVARDITERKRIVGALQESEARFRTLADAAPGLIWTADPDGAVNFCNAQWYAYTGATPAQSHGQGWADFVHPDDLPQLNRHWSHALAHGTSYQVEGRFRGADGQHRWYLIRAQPQLDEQGRVQQWFGTDTDVHELKHLQQTLLESEQYFREMANHVPAMIWVTGPEGQCTYLNQQWFEFTGQTEAEALGFGWLQAVHPDDAEAAGATFREANVTRTPFRLVYRLRRHDGQYRWAIDAALPRFDATGQYEGMVGTVFDIHERQLAEQALQRLTHKLRTARDQAQTLNEELQTTNQELLRTNADLDNFIYIASHDLKAPITNIEGLVDALQHDLPPEVQQTPTVAPLLTMMHDSVDRFKRTLGHLTDLTKLQKEQEQPVDQVSLPGMVDDVLLDLRLLIQQHRAVIEADLTGCPNITFAARNLRSVVYNLVSNALKYRHPDRIPLVRIGCQSEAHYVVLSVQDNGLGLTKEQQQSLFAMFRRLHTHVEGSGVGLYMVKKIIDNAGGRIEVESVPGEGSTFRVYLPS